MSANNPLPNSYFYFWEEMPQSFHARESYTLNQLLHFAEDYHKHQTEKLLEGMEEEIERNAKRNCIVKSSRPTYKSGAKMVLEEIRKRLS